MSRTYRKPELVLYYSKEELLIRDLSWNNIAKYKRVEESVIRNGVKKQWREWHQDGRLSESGKRSGFKQAAARVVRRANKRLAMEIISGIDEEKTSYPHTKMGKSLAWNFW